MIISDMEKSFLESIKPLAELKEAVEKLEKAFEAFVKFFDAQRTFDKLNTQLMVVTGSVANASLAFKELQAIAAVTPFNVEETAKAFMKLKTSGLDPSEKALRAYGNTAAGLGQSLDTVVDAVADAAQGNFKELEKLGFSAEESGGRVSLAFDGVKATVGNNAKEIEAWLQQLGQTRFGDAMQVQAASLDGALGNLHDAWEAFKLSLSQAGLGEVARAGIEAVTDALKVFAEHADAIVSGLKYASEIVAAYFAAFVAGPAIVTAVTTAFVALEQQVQLTRLALAIGASATDVLTNSFGGMSVSAQLAEGSLTKVRLAGNLMMAAFAGYEIGSWLNDNFVEARLAGLTFVGVMLTGWENLKYGAQVAWETISFSWDAVIGTMREKFADFMSATARGLARVGATDTAKDVDAYANQLRAASNAQGSYSDRIAVITAAHKAAVAEIDNNIVELMRYEMTVKKVAATTTSALARKGAGTSKESNAHDKAAVAQQIEQNQQLAWSYGLTSDKLAEMTQARMNAQQAAFSTDVGKALDEQIEADRKLDAARRSAPSPATKEETESLKKMWESVEQSAHKAFTSIFEKGKNAFSGLRDTLKNGLIDLLYQMTVKKWVLNIGASLGLTGAAGLAQAAGADGAGGGGAVDLVKTASNLFKSVKDSFTEFSTTIGKGISNVGNMLGSDSVASFGQGMQGLGASGNAVAGYGQMAGSVLSAGAGAMAGYGIGTAISGQYGSKGVVAAGTAVGAVVGSIIPVIGTALGAAIGGAIGGVLNRAFGMGDKEVTSRGIRGTLTTSGVTGSSYSNWHQDGGWFRSDRNGTDTSALGADIVKQFSDGLAALVSASSGFAATLGVSADAIKGYSTSFDIALTQDAAKNQQAVADYFTGVGNDIANKLVPNLDQFAKSGESASATLQRLAGDFQATNQAAQLIGKTAQEAFGAIGLASAAARERLVDLAGGTNALGTQTTFYAQNFLTEAQRLEPVQEALTAAMAGLGLSSVQTRAQFKAVIDSLDLTTEAGAKQFAAMMKLAEAFAQVHPATASATDSVASARAALTAAYEKEADALQATVDRMSNFAASLRKLHDSALLGNLSTLTPQQKYLEAKAQYEKTLGAARAGDADAQNQYQGAYQAFLSASQAVNASGAQYQRDFAYAQAATEEAIQWAQQQVDVGKASLTALNLQVAGLIDVKKEVTSVAQAIRDLAGLMGPAGAGAVAASQESAITSLYQSMLHRAPDAAGLKFWEQALASGMSIADIAQEFSRSDEYQGLVAGQGTMSGGGADVRLQDTAAYLAPSAPVDYSAMGTSNMTALVGEIKALRADNQSLRDEVRGLRSDGERQTGDLMAANAAVSDNSAGKIAEATTRAALIAAQTRETRVMPT